MSSDNSDSGSIALSLVAQFDDINRLNNVLNDGAAEELFLSFLSQMQWVMNQWATAEAEAVRLQKELDEAHRTLTKSEAKFAHVRKMLDGEKREKNIYLKKYNEQSKLLDMARDLLFNDNRAKLNDETLQKLAFLNGTAQQDHNAKLTGVPELNSTGELLGGIIYVTKSDRLVLADNALSFGTLLSEMSYSRSEDDLDLSLASTRRSWVQRGQWAARDQLPNKKRRSSSSSVAKTVELQSGKVLATATTTLTLERAPTCQDLKPPQNFQPISESSDEGPPPRKSPARMSSARHHPIEVHCTPPPPPAPSAPPKSESESTSDSPVRAQTQSARAPQRTPSLVSSPRARLRQHNFVAKNFYKRETCGPCGKTIKFAKVGVKCEWCRAQAHPECRALLPLPCVPPGRAPHHQERFLRGCGSPQLSGEDIHTVCGCVKEFLRSLREPLVTSALWTDFVSAARLPEPDASAAAVHALSQLPQPNRDTLAFLMLHLQKVSESPECEMGVDNLAKMFAPGVVGYGLASGAAEMYSATAHMFSVMQLLLKLPGDYWAQWACPGSPAAAHAHAHNKPRGFFFSPADTG
ncbi:Rac GTPase-activating protein 1 [Papilio machaon]|uniref:Rac GTPase-activating protein 1 n=1 Tax=Papilio machaon TaxID=76193 RepID=A0A194RGU9_PAPMA|nr:Rac GTPase-activating protein 1 [Papilio machaon]